MGSSDEYMYFILLEKPHFPYGVKAGHICYIEEKLYLSRIQMVEKIDKLPVICMGYRTDNHLTLDILRLLSLQEAELLQALQTDEERLESVLDRTALDGALDLAKDSPVTVEIDGAWLRGVVRYIGRITEPKIPDHIVGTFFGVELQGTDKGKGQNNGTYQNRTLFTCQEDCGVFATFTRVKPAGPKPTTPASQQPPGPAKTPVEHLAPGDRVTFFMADDNVGRHGMVMALEKKDDQMMALISTDTDDRGQKGGHISVPLNCVIIEELLTPETERVEQMDTSEAAVLEEDVIPGLIGVNSLVEVSLAAGRTAYGTIRWIGKLPGMTGIRAGLELEEDLGVSDGTFKEQRIFSCPSKRGLFVKLESCHPDARFQGAEQDGAYFIVPPEIVAPIRSEDVAKVLIGRMKGIQGHCNSCYMDSALFSLFSCSSVLDSLLFKSTEPKDQPIQNTLLHDIVKPLRSQGFVRDSSVMRLRQQLQDRGYCSTYTTDEKDPEEFLTLIMQKILSLEPPLKLSMGGKGNVETSYYYQIFLDLNHSLVLPTVQQLLEHSFFSTGLKLAEVPSCLILTMPRFGKKFKMFEKIVPSLELDITDLLLEGPQQCVMCGCLAYEECVECFRDPVFSNTGFKHFCQTCSSQVHTHPTRQSHKPSVLRLPEGYPHPKGRGGSCRSLPRERMQLFAVLCIETSHYVSFVKHGPQTTDWMFFDSMADREGERYGFNIPQVQACPEVGRYLSMPLAELANQVPRDMDGVAKRLFCDAYMYLYQSPSMALYH